MTTELKEIEGFCTNTETGVSYAYVNGIKREIKRFNDGTYIFVSSTKVLPNIKHISPIGKPTKYANIFNEEGQISIENYLKS